LDFYRQLLLLRHFDDRCVPLKLKDLIMDGFHPYVGQEAVAVGVCANLRPEDVVISNHRPQGHSLAKGSTVRSLYAEMLGRIGGVSDGLGGPMQWVDKEHNFYCGSIVGSGITVAAGVGLAAQYLRQDCLACCFFGDGASNTGSFHEGLNLAALWKLPVLYVCENNQYGEAMPVGEFVPVPQISMRAAAYGIPGVSVDGMNVFEVAAAVREAVARIRQGGGPELIEVMTYRFRGHYLGDPLNYRTKEEVAEWQKRDPLPGCRETLLREFGYSADELDALDQQMARESDEARDWALEQPKLTIAQAVTHVEVPLDPERPQYAGPPADETRTLTYAEAITEAYIEEFERDPNVILMGEDVGVWGNLFGCSRGLLEKFGPERVRDTPISEAAIAGAAVGASMNGLRPIIEIMYIDFISIALDQLINHAARYPQMGRGTVRVPITVRTQGGVGFRNSSQHSQSLENWFVNVPGLYTVMAATPYDVKGLLKAAIRCDNPVIFIEHKAVYRLKGPVPKSDYVLPLGRAAVKRPGRDVTIVANSWMSLHALTAAEELAQQGISCEVIDPLTLYPLDKETICQSVSRTGYCVVVNEAPAEGGFASEVAAVVQEGCWPQLKAPVLRVCGMRTGIPYDKDLERAVVPSPPWITAAVKKLLHK
jgi:pyruvate/2-oxoglutarate/acetoin dehydrogenase E1 component/TPP-dependent pyruvate/acetoin dehydrogenase alpha subunit